jgi:DnaJ-class molecular chaperone
MKGFKASLMILIFLGIAISFVSIALGDIYQDGETCLQCHEEKKIGHQTQKEDCAKCHNPGKKKEVHNLTVFAGNDVTDPEIWREWCSSCHQKKDGHIANKENCRKCHGSGGKKDVHIEMSGVELIEIDCSWCHDPMDGILPVSGCTSCHQYGADGTEPWYEPWHSHECLICHRFPESPPGHLIIK